jgi:hypothetical protein
VMDGGDAEAPGGEEHRLPERAGLPAEVHPSRRGPRGVEWWWSSSSFVRLNYNSIDADDARLEPPHDDASPSPASDRRRRPLSLRSTAHAYHHLSA